jgi:hypothetical protein
MKLITKIFLAIFFLAVISLAYWLISPLFITIELDEPLPQSAKKEVDDIVITNEKEATLIEDVGSGDFKPAAHSVAGSVRVVDVDGKKYLRFEDFETDNGPDLRIYLSPEKNVEDSIDLGELKGTKGNFQYEIPSDVDIEKYSNVLVWCRAFEVLFSSAELT